MYDAASSNPVDEFSELVKTEWEMFEGLCQASYQQFQPSKLD